jgi:hypothetical protein
MVNGTIIGDRSSRRSRRGYCRSLYLVNGNLGPEPEIVRPGFGSDAANLIVLSKA